MTTRDSALAKLQQLSESLVQEVSDFIDFVIHKHQSKIDSQDEEQLRQKWVQWFDEVERLEVFSPASTSNYQQLLLDKYRKQGLQL
jgi:hypothetical protein